MKLIVKAISVAVFLFLLCFATLVIATRITIEQSTRENPQKDTTGALISSKQEGSPILSPENRSYIVNWLPTLRLGRLGVITEAMAKEIIQIIIPAIQASDYPFVKIEGFDRVFENDAFEILMKGLEKEDPRKV